MDPLCNSCRKTAARSPCLPGGQGPIERTQGTSGSLANRGYAVRRRSGEPDHQTRVRPRIAGSGPEREEVSATAQDPVAESSYIRETPARGEQSRRKISCVTSNVEKSSGKIKRRLQVLLCVQIAESQRTRR